MKKSITITCQLHTSRAFLPDLVDAERSCRIRLSARLSLAYNWLFADLTLKKIDINFCGIMKTRLF